jgi:hypothetical protein
MKSIITLAILLLSAGMFAQTTFGEIKGKVRDSSNNELLPFVNVWVEANGSKIGAVTDLNGKYTIKPLNAGKYSVYASFVGYRTTVIANVVVKPDQITFPDDIALNEQGGEILPPIVIEARIKLIEAETHNKVSINSKAIMASPVKQNINKLAGATGSVQVSEDGNEVYFRGSRNGDVIYLVDGVKIQGARPTIPSAGIQSLSVYSGGLPAKYGDTMGGVIVVETKSYFDMYYESLGNR